MNPDSATTLAGFIKAAAGILGILGVSIAPEHVTAITVAATSVWAVAEVIHGWFTNKKID